MEDCGFAGPAGEGSPTGIDIDPRDGALFLVGAATDRVYRYFNSAWDAGITMPAGEARPLDVAIDKYNPTTPPTPSATITQEFDLLSGWWSQFSQTSSGLTTNFRQWRPPDGQRPQINANLAPDGESRYLSAFVVWQTSGGTVSGMELHIASNQFETYTDPGDDLVDGFQTDGKAILRIGSTDYEFEINDNHEPYS